MKLKIDFYESINKIIWVLTVAFLTLIVITSTNVYGRYILIGFSMAIMMLSAILNGGHLKFKIEDFHKKYLLFGTYCFISSVWALNPSMAITQGTTMLLLVICMSFIYIHYQNEPDIWKLYSAVKWSGIILCVYTLFNRGLDNVFLILAYGGRLQVEFANINTVSMAASFSIIIILYEILFKQQKIINVFLCIPSAIIIAASGTRKSLLIVLFGLALLIYFRYKGKNFVKTLIKISTASIISIFGLWFLFSLPIFSEITERMKGVLALFTGEGVIDASSALRSKFIEIGLTQFFKTPIFGIGMGSSGELLLREYGVYTYLHNNYIELLCCGGIIGFILYYSIHRYCLANFFKYKNYENGTVKLGLILVLIVLLVDTALVSYDSKSTFFYMMIFFLQVKQLKSEALQNENT